MTKSVNKKTLGVISLIFTLAIQSPWFVGFMEDELKDLELLQDESDDKYKENVRYSLIILNVVLIGIIYAIMKLACSYT